MTDIIRPASRLTFDFGKNWTNFLSTVDAARILAAEQSLKEALGLDSLRGRRFLDVGCGSGLFSLAARRLDAVTHSFDVNPRSVACAGELKRRYFPTDALWTIECGSALDRNYLRALGRFDVVYSWGVLHHTGDMWSALGDVCERVADGGLLYLAIYNDQGTRSVWWRQVKRLYNRLPTGLRTLYAGAFAVAFECAALTIAVGSLSPRRVLRRWTRYGATRGMSRWHDIVDWIGGYPFEVAKPEEVFSFCANRGFQLRWLKTCAGRMGCNEFVFTRERRAHVA